MPNVTPMQDDVPGIVLRPEGEIDLATAEPFRRTVHAALQAQPNVLVIDLRDVSFLDSSGLSVLAAALKGQRSRDAIVALVNPQSIVRRAIELVGLDVLFDLTEVPAELLDAPTVQP